MKNKINFLIVSVLLLSFYSSFVIAQNINNSLVSGGSFAPPIREEPPSSELLKEINDAVIHSRQGIATQEELDLIKQYHVKVIGSQSNSPGSAQASIPDDSFNKINQLEAKLKMIWIVLGVFFVITVAIIIYIFKKDL